MSSFATSPTTGRWLHPALPHHQPLDVACVQLCHITNHWTLVASSFATSPTTGHCLYPALPHHQPLDVACVQLCHITNHWTLVVSSFATSPTTGRSLCLALPHHQPTTGGCLGPALPNHQPLDVVGSSFEPLDIYINHKLSLLLIKSPGSVLSLHTPVIVHQQTHTQSGHTLSCCIKSQVIIDLMVEQM